ncbi:hypothetical protein EIN_327350 [Entamoeba invadens IP1]|uniref:Cupin type-2 domain-containing protein n=1 Tax=Entamoeba invadens IP1 TaxID=370355 RepID=A0A0A1U0K5_ENTIV|nr:hypothetical protein EIN_327350 [Entamoeba invadens IP1]ELP86088.1 hypothetical protein EIN_327350 [Entamoeba invadens IP1]|eukprot:XP_004185434.1 hypothetical protein EIN_327350 [Entamoeba invadens IP1]
MCAKVEKILQTETTWDGAHLPQYPTGPAEISVLRITVPPHTKMSFHHHPVINCAYILQGTLHVTTKNGETHCFKAGEAMAEVIGTSHFGENRDDVPMQMVVVYAGVKGEAITIQDN